MAPTTSYTVIASSEDWSPLIGVEVEAVHASTRLLDDVQTTDLGGVATFTGLTAGPHLFKARARRVSTSVTSKLDPSVSRTYIGQVRLLVVAMGNQGITKHYVVDANGMGTHTTIQAAVTAAVADADEDDIVIYINPGTYEENVTVTPTDSKHIVFIGEGCLDDMHSGGYNAVVEITVASGGEASPVFAITGTAGRVSFIGLKITGVTGGAVSSTSSFELAFTHCRLSTGTTVETIVSSSSYRTDTTFNNCVLLATSVRFMDSTSVNTYIHHCYVNCAGLITSGVSNLHVSDCRLIAGGNLAADEYFIHETGGIGSVGIYVQDCYYGGGGAGFLAAGRSTKSFVIADNHIIVNTGDTGIALAGSEEGTISGNIFEGASDSDSATGISLTASIVACGGLAIIANAFIDIQTGISVGASGTDGTCAIGPNAFHNVGTETSGVPAAEDYQVSLATASCALLDGTIHTDTVAQGVTRGSLIYGNDTPAWDELVKGAEARILQAGADDISWVAVSGDATIAAGGAVTVAATHSGSAHHTKYTNLEAIAAIEGEATLALDGAITEIHGDANFTLSIVSSNPRLTLDSGDYLEYNRASNYLYHNQSLVVAGTVTVGADAVLTRLAANRLSLGTIELGTRLAGTYCYVGNSALDQTAAGNYALIQSDAGLTCINAATGQVLYFRIANVTVGTFSGTTFAVGTIAELTADAGVTIEGTKLIDSYILLAEITTPANPSDGYGKLYMKNDDKLYFLSTGGTEYDLTSGVGDAADITYTPGTAADWDSDADPGDVNDALDQLAERTTDIEEKGVYEYSSSASSVWGTAGVWQSGTPFIGSVSGATTSTSVTYNHTSGEGGIMRGMVLHNTTKGEMVYISAVNIATNTLTVEANSPDDASTWDNLDVLTTASQTNTGRTGTFVDVDVTPFLGGANATACYISGYTTRQNADTWFLIVHPYEAYDVDKEMSLAKQWQDDTLNFRAIIPLVAANGRHYFTLNLLGLAAANAATMGRWAGQFTKLVA